MGVLPSPRPCSDMRIEQSISLIRRGNHFIMGLIREVDTAVRN